MFILAEGHAEMVLNRSGALKLEAILVLLGIVIALGSFDAIARLSTYTEMYL